MRKEEAQTRIEEEESDFTFWAEGRGGRSHFRFLWGKEGGPGGCGGCWPRCGGGSGRRSRWREGLGLRGELPIREAQSRPAHEEPEPKRGSFKSRERNEFETQ